MLESTLLLIFPAAMIFAAIMDLFTMTIPNRISIAMIAGFALVAPFSGMPVEAIGLHVIAGLGMLALCLFMFWRGWIGGGDAKLLSVAALWIGVELLVPFMAYVGILGGVLAVALLLYRKYIPEVWIMRQEWTARLHKENGGIPYGIAIAAAAVWIYPKTAWFAGLSSIGT